MSTFTEKYDLKKICWLLENLDNIDLKKESIKPLKKFLENVLTKNGEICVEYFFAKYCNYGRRYAVNGIQSIPRNIRNFLLITQDDSKIIDYDIENCHPTILYHLCLKHKIHSHHLEEYALNRSSVFDNYFKCEIESGVNIKKQILTATNSDDPIITNNKWLIDYQKEINHIQNELKKQTIYKKILFDTDRVKQDSNNQNSSFVNRILCKVESEIIDNFVKIAGEDNVVALMFDGLLIRSNSNDDIILNNFNEFIRGRYGEYFSVVKKQITTDISMDDGYIEDVDKLLECINSLEVRLKYFQDKFKPIKIVSPPLYGIIINDGNYEFQNKAQFINSVEHIRYINEKNENCSIVSYWLKNCITNDNIYNSIITDPTYSGTDCYNLWKDWAINSWDGEWTDDKDAVEYMRKHLLILCNKSEEVRESIEKWIAHAFKYPKSKSFVPIFVGRQGAGKDMFIAWIVMMMGEDKVLETSTPEKNVWGAFNPFMAKAFLIHLSEFGKKQTSNYTEQIKAITTAGTIVINEKNKGEYQIKSHHRFLGASNHNEPIPIEEDNRRYLIVHTSPEKIGNTEYFKQGWGYLDNKNAIKSMYNYFMSLDVPPSYQYNMIIESEYMENLKQINRAPEAEWWDCYVIKNYDKYSEKNVEHKLMDWYTDYKNWCIATKQEFPQAKKKFYKTLDSDFIDNGIVHKLVKKPNGTHVMNVDWNSINV